MSKQFINTEQYDRVLEVNLNAIKHNFKYYKSLLKSKTKILVVVKADAYGLGSIGIVKFLQNIGIDYLGVASAGEGIELRESGVTCPIIVFNPAIQDLYKLVEFDLEPNIYSFNLLNSWIQKIKNDSIAPKIHIKIDTGMHRLGFVENEISELIALINDNRLSIASVFTHLAGTDESVHSEYTKKQIYNFKLCCKQIKESINQQFIEHALNSAGIISYPEGQLNMVRLGIGLYGFDPVNNDNNLQVVASLYSVISQIKNIKKGETIGYGRVGVAENDMQTATINIGYADGVSRQLSDGVGSVTINNKKAKIIGNICMEMWMVEVSAIDCREGDKVEIFGSSISIVEISKQINTIPYEVLTSVSQRVKRVYFKEN